MRTFPLQKLSLLSSLVPGVLWAVVAFWVLRGALPTHQGWRITCATIGLLIPVAMLAAIGRRWQRLPKQQ